MSSAIPPFTPEESARLTQIWDRLYELYLNVYRQRAALGEEGN